MFRRRALRRRLTAAGAPTLPDAQLRALDRALSAGPTGALCASVERPIAQQVRLATARAYRWPDLPDATELKRLPYCMEQDCCNPFHWSRLCKPETPPPPYSRLDMGELKTKEVGDSTKDARRTDHERLATGSLTTDGEERQSWELEWCRLAYWELGQRVGRQVGVRSGAVDVYSGASGPSGPSGAGRAGLCLDTVGDERRPQPEQVRRTRSKIGRGVTVSLENGVVWIYNMGVTPIFISSPALDAVDARAVLVYRVSGGWSLPVVSRWSPAAPRCVPAVGPVDPASVRVSFAKGWGPKYSRRDITACPCWLEVLLAPTPS